MSRALVATGATSSLSLLFQVIRFLSSPSGPIVPPSSDPLESAICSALAPETGDQTAIHWHSFLLGVLAGFLLIPFCEAVISARLLAYRAVLRRFGFTEREPLYRLL